jgi:CRP-like cAMP-binding protein
MNSHTARVDSSDAVNEFHGWESLNGDPVSSPDGAVLQADCLSEFHGPDEPSTSSELVDVHLRLARVEQGLFEQGKAMRSLLAVVQQQKSQRGSDTTLFQSFDVDFGGLDSAVLFDPLSTSVAMMRSAFESGPAIERSSPSRLECSSANRSNTNLPGAAADAAPAPKRSMSTSVRPSEGGRTFSTDTPLVIAADVLYVAVAFVSSIVSMTLIFSHHSWSRSPESYEVVLLAASQVFGALWIFLQLRVHLVLEDWTVVCEQEAIQQHYFATWWWWLDCLITFPIEFAFIGWANVVFKGLAVRHVLRLVRTFSLIKSSEPLRGLREPFRLLSIFLSVGVGVHCLSLILRESIVQELDYVQSLFFVTGVMTSVGYKEFTSRSELFQIYGSAIMPIGTVLLGFSVAVAITHINTVDKFVLEMDEKKLRLLSILTYFRIPWDLQKDIVCTFSVNLDRENQREMKELIKALPASVSAKLDVYLRVRFLRAMPTFETLGAEHTEALAALCSVLTTKLYLAGERVFAKGDTGDELYIIRNGIVSVTVPAERDSSGDDDDEPAPEDALVATLSSGQMFGEIAVVEKVVRSATVTAVAPCEMLVLSADAFHEISRSFPQLEELVTSFSLLRRKTLTARNLLDLKR